MNDAIYSDEADQEERIAKLRAELEKLGGGSIPLESMSADMEEEFLKYMLEYANATPISPFALLENAGFEIPAPSTLIDEVCGVCQYECKHLQLGSKLRELIERMATLGCYLLHTNHLSDRALYEYLYNDGLREEAVLFPENPGYAYTIDLTGSGSEEDNQLYLKHYADEEHRRQWAHDWPDYPIPEHEAPPFNRDSTLPHSPLG